MPIDFNSLFGGPGVGSMQPGRVVSIQTKSPPSITGGGRNQLDLTPILRGMQQAQQQANQANLDRYNNMMGYVNSLQENLFGQGGIYSQAQEQLQGVGDAARQRVQTSQARQQANAEQDLISRGLGNTTVRSSVRRGISSDAERAQQAIDEQVAQRQAGFLQNYGQARAGFGQFAVDSMLSRQDQTQNMGLYLQLLQQLAAQGG